VLFVVDDDPSVRTSMSRLLHGVGYDVQTFSSTAGLFESGRPLGPCCMILDVQMPDVNGLSFQHALDQIGVRVPTIFITGFASLGIGVEAMKGGAQDFLPKPFEVE